MPGPEFGKQGDGFVRLNFACSPEVLTESIQRLARAAREVAAVPARTSPAVPR